MSAKIGVACIYKIQFVVIRQAHEKLSRIKLKMTSSPRGLRLLKAIQIYAKEKSNYFDSNMIFNKVKVSSVSDGSVKGTLIVDSTMCNGGGTLHGGYIATIIDGISLFTQLAQPAGKLAWTTSMHVNFLKSSKIGEKVTVEATILKSGSFPVVETCLRDDTGAIVAKGSVSFMAGSEKYQQMTKEVYKFDVYEQ